ncbi:protein phosphatase 2C domain-containing protein [Planomonospora corallina]|uniref:Protein phosphatase 2C domain-containing protein n=1 Tax=Planomonospora corallina TaxID=1806052 RepID=A0ABV8IG50_9ACTN
MNSSPDPRVAASPYTIGDPGRAGRELPAGPPGPQPGLSDNELSAACLPGVLMRAATFRGLLHRSRNELRQDAFAWGHLTDSGGATHAVAVVCDGVGSLGRSHEAAALVSRRLAELGQTGMAWADCFTTVNRELHDHAARMRERRDFDPGRDGMATTAVALSVHWSGEEWVGEVAWIGDSPLLWLSPDGTWASLTEPDGDEEQDGFHSTGVRPLPSRDGTCLTRRIRLTGGALFLMTDGIANPLRWAADVQSTLAQWWARPPDPFTFAAQAAFSRKTHMDDRTVVALWPEQDETPHPGDGRPPAAHDSLQEERAPKADITRDGAGRG